MTLLLFLSIFLSTFVAIGPAVTKNPDHMIVATVSEPETVDPASAYDSASLELIGNVYDTLIRYDRESTDKFVPCLATNWGMSEDGLTFWFKIREGVRFHNGDILTTEDVEYTFERWMVQDKSDGPTWMILEPLFGVYSIADLGDIETSAGRAQIATRINNAVERNNTYVQFHLAETFASMVFYQTIAQPFSSILNKHWCIDHGDWPGTWSNWINYYDPALSPLEDPPTMMGTGPYKFDYWNKGSEWSIVKNDNYWQGWPAPRCGGYVQRVTVKLISDWATRKLMFLAGDCDLCYVPRQYTDQILGEPGIRSVYPLLSLSVDNLFFQFDIAETSPYGPIYPAGMFSEASIPSDFFGNPVWGVHVREAFAHCFDFSTFIAEVFGGEGITPATAIIPGLFGYDPTIRGYSYNLTSAAQQFKMVPGLWATGFTITIPYTTGNSYELAAVQMLKASVEALNPKFHVTALSLDWSSYLWALTRRQLPCFVAGWLADYPDAYDFAVPFYASYGVFAYWQGYSNSEMDDLIDESIRVSNPDARMSICREIAELAIEDCPSVPLFQPFGRHFERDWVQGWYYNPVYPGNYYYHLWKGELSSAREDQILIEEVINPSNLTTDIIAFRWPEPLVSGDVIIPSVPQEGEEHSVLTPKWFYWIDDCPYSMFAHDTRYVFIDDETGEYEVIREGWPPSLNGQEMWSTPEEFWNPNNWVYSTLTNSSELSVTYGTADLNSLTVSKTISAANIESQSGNQALIIEGHDETGSGKNASELWYSMLLNFGYTDQQITYLAWENRPLVDGICTRENVFNAITTLSNTLAYGDTLTLYIFAHGDRTYKNTPSESGFIKLTETGNNKLYDWELNQSLSQIQNGVHINIVMESCYAGSFMDDLWMLENVDVIITSTDWKSETYLAWLDPPINFQYITGLTHDPNIEDEGGEFSSGLVEGLNELKQQYHEVGLLYLNAFNKAKERDASYINCEKLAAYYKNPEKASCPLLKMVYYLCDVNHDGKVNIMDISLAALHYGTSPGSSRWNPEVNMNRDRLINIVDLTIIAKEYGRVYF